MRRLLLFEFLHADSDAFVTAADRMRSEGRAMLQAVLTDAVALPDLSVTVLLCEAAQAALNSLPAGCELLGCRDLSPLDALASAAGDFDFVLPVVPECDGLLLRVAQTLQPLKCTTLLPSLSVVETCSDKLRTWDAFCSSLIPMIECMSACCDSSKSGFSDPGAIFKPRRGAGCEGIQRGQLPTTANPQDYIRQPFIKGSSLSIGVLSSPGGIQLLPVARQDIIWQGVWPKYNGGTIPADISCEMEARVTSIAEYVMQQIGRFTGYLGMDFLVVEADGMVFLNEINPRVCTSYVGYRQLLEFNPLGVLLGYPAGPVRRAASRSISFRSDGEPKHCETGEPSSNMTRRPVT